ncbi:Iduronate 2-sulfatase [Hondaea fermentalgiana]|uniref:Iduronate 2-sulfatase n=1 Tax=Hondaea fermentalgiana TaxID=2315210 RepID=A0A2R5GKU1_9STRA|nr:Iduronate 2-sulfatase [Hondaea fermentalgiana]|eukprot:GBG31522.1 Iduronate 2-sulfatase [Hondaea fermentalgiana]
MARGAWKAALVAAAAVAVSVAAAENAEVAQRVMGGREVTPGQTRESRRAARRRTADSSDSEQLNVLFIVVDDMRVESKLYDRPWDLMPNVDAWAKSKGAQQFDHAYTSEPLCGPSRASFMTSRTTMSLEFHTNTGLARETEVLFDDADNLLMTDWFNDNDFSVAGVSKIYHYQQTNEDAFAQADANYQSEPSKLVDDACDGGLRCGESNDTELVDKVATNWALDELDTLKDSTEPFFMAVGMHRPHLPFRVPQAHIDRVVELTGLKASQASEVDLHHPGAPASYYDIPGDSVPIEAYSYCPNLEDYADWDSDTDMVDYVSLGYYAAISYIDEEVGKILAKLEEVGLANSTIVSITADHGWSLGEHGAWCKRSEYELVTHVPLWIHDPRATATDALTYNRRGFMSLIDLYPTIADLAGIPLSVSEYEDYSIQGVSRAANYFRSEISATTTEVLQQVASAEGHSFGYPVDAAFTVQPACFDSSGDTSVCDTVLEFDYMGLSVRTENFRYTEWWPWDDSSASIDFSDGLPDGKQELYDHRTDSFELVNLASNSSYSDIVSEHALYLRAYYLDCSTLSAGTDCNAEAHCMTVDSTCYLRSDCSALTGLDDQCNATGYCQVSSGSCIDTTRVAALTTASPTASPTPNPTTPSPTEAPVTPSPTREGETPAPTSSDTSGESVSPGDSDSAPSAGTRVAVASVVTALTSILALLH